VSRRLRLGLFAGLLLAGGAATAHDAKKPLRILHVMSYEASMAWAAGQFAGFKEALADVQMEYRVVELDVLRDRSPHNAEKRARVAHALMESWKPDLLYASDDAAQKYVAARYAGKAVPVVFSGVNAEPADYGYQGVRNVTGIIEHEHFPESVRLLRAIVPGARRIAAIFDPSPHWASLRERMRASLAEIPEVEVVAWDIVADWEDYQQKIAEYPGKADAIALIGYFEFANGGGPSNAEVMKWTAEHSRLPDLSLWGLRVKAGTLAAVTVSDREQGLAAGRLARAILLDGRQPGSLAMTPTRRGVSMISLARARNLGLRPSSSVLLSAEVVERFDWGRQ
jgi:ABC-type uncharacterized transport system substrate-binding protein